MCSIPPRAWVKEFSMGHRVTGAGVAATEGDKQQEAQRKKIRFRCDQSSTSLLTSALRDRGWVQVEEGDESWNVFWCDVTQVKCVLDSRRLEPHQKITHFRNHFELTRKNLLARNLKRLKRLYQREGHTSEAELCDCMPLTFELPSEYLMFVESYRRLPGATWIVKPACGSQGRGIFLFQRLRDLVEWRSKARDSAEKEALPFYQDAEQLHELYVVQRYVEEPYLLAGRKFDLRLYVLVTSYHPLKAWLSRDGFARLSMAQFSLNEIDNSSVHLTNTSVQLRASSRAREKGCKWNLQRLREFLTARHGSQEVENLFQRVAQVVLTSLQSVQPVINQDRHCFELYGYDVLLDKCLRPWLLEVNASPSMGPTDRADRRLKYGIISDTFNVVDLEGRLTGRERRVGGFDLLWDGGPVWATSPGSEDCSGDGRTHITEDTSRLNVFLGCNNDREEQLVQVWENARAFFNQQQCEHT